MVVLPRLKYLSMARALQYIRVVSNSYLCRLRSNAMQRLAMGQVLKLGGPHIPERENLLRK